MTGIIISITIALLIIVVIQIGKVTELAARIRGEEKVEQASNNRTAFWLLIFMIVFIVFCFASAYFYKNSMLGYGPHKAASEHGSELDKMFDITLIYTGIVFVITQVALFWFAYKYRRKKGRKAYFFPHNNTLELIWTIIPTIVLVYLVVKGLIVWNEVMPDIDPGDTDYIEVEVAGYQFAWDLRYPGPDGKLGTRDFRLIDLANNPLGQDWSDPKNIDDFQPTELVLPVDRKVRVRITAKDVLHNFYLPHFRVKMDAIPGLPTYFIFTPTKTTLQYREELRKYPEWQVPADETDPEGPKRWEEFNYELACAELCGQGHYSMRRMVRIVSEPEYQQWLATQQSYYRQNIRNTEDDPFLGQILNIEIQERSTEFSNQINRAINNETAREEPVVLEHVWFETGTESLQDGSSLELNDLAAAMSGNPGLRIELTGHVYSGDNPEANLQLSVARAERVKEYLVEQGVEASRITSSGAGESEPLESADTEDVQRNDRIEMKITAI